jgi:hypothetical protein
METDSSPFSPNWEDSFDPHSPSEVSSPFLDGFSVSPPPIARHGKWSSIEDAALKDAVDFLGTKSWAKIAQRVETRNAKQCRERWVDHFAQNFKMGKWEVWEDCLILEKRQEFGQQLQKCYPEEQQLR